MRRIEFPIATMLNRELGRYTASATVSEKLRETPCFAERHQGCELRRQVLQFWRDGTR
jgi:hypothetical protein